jgi:predicted TIM-barrel fold metal-dependent hydrolase
MIAPHGIVDTLCNAFFPDREAVWDAAIAGQGVPLKVRRDPRDAFCDPATMVARMDDTGVATVLIPTGDLHRHGTLFEYDPVAARPEETAALVDQYPGRFAAWWCVNPQLGMAGVTRARQMLAEHDWIVGLWIHTHSFDRRFDHPDYYPHYALAAEFGVPVAMQAGTSGGLMPSECGAPIGIDRPAIYFRDVNFVLSHLGWPWVDETLAMALKFPNVYVGTAAYPPAHWSPSVLDFLRRPGRRKVLYATNFPTVGFRHAAKQLAELDVTDEVRALLLHDNARRIFTRLSPSSAVPPTSVPPSIAPDQNEVPS